VLKKALLWHFMWHPCLRMLCSPPLLIENEKSKLSLILLQHTAKSNQLNVILLQNERSYAKFVSLRPQFMDKSKKKVPLPLPLPLLSPLLA
jgi:hypothetical protein